MVNYLYEDKLETERLVTRKLVSDDYKTWSVFFEDKDAVEFIIDSTVTDTAERARHWIERQRSRYENKLFGLQALIDKRSKEFVGMCGLLLQEVEGVKELEIGYHIFKKHWGKGYAPEAAILFKEYAFKNKLSSSVISIIHVNNVRSQSVALKNGMTPEKRCLWNNLDVFIYRTRDTNPLH
jgi:ribosomal-protein-alanine N-acetyltransferase